MDSFGRFDQVLLCDDIRVETNGKYIIIGMYTSEILIADFPAYLPLRAMMAYTREEIGPQKIDFIWTMDDAPLAEMEGGVDQQTLNLPITIALPPVPLYLEAPGQLQLSARLTSGERALLLSRAVKRSDEPIPRV